MKKELLIILLACSLFTIGLGYDADILFSDEGVVSMRSWAEDRFGPGEVSFSPAYELPLSDEYVIEGDILTSSQVKILETKNFGSSQYSSTISIDDSVIVASEGLDVGSDVLRDKFYVLSVRFDKTVDMTSANSISLFGREYEIDEETDDSTLVLEAMDGTKLVLHNNRIVLRKVKEGIEEIPGTWVRFESDNKLAPVSSLNEIRFSVAGVSSERRVIVDGFRDPIFGSFEFRVHSTDGYSKIVLNS